MCDTKQKPTPAMQPRLKPWAEWGGVRFTAVRRRSCSWIRFKCGAQVILT
jgi:hypothetical protein